MDTSKPYQERRERRPRREGDRRPGGNFNRGDRPQGGNFNRGDRPQGGFNRGNGQARPQGGFNRTNRPAAPAKEGGAQ